MIKILDNTFKHMFNKKFDKNKIENLAKDIIIYIKELV